MKKALTLIELMVVIIIMGVLATLALPRFAKTLETNRAKEARAALEQIRAGERIYRSSEGFYYPYHPSAAQTDEATINSFLKLFLDTREIDWKYQVDTDSAGDFTATAEREGGANDGETITIDETSPPSFG
ncbi:MAG: type II secretion system protein, partial [Candidatus Omnitrophica bacterium]|nr:type II secretion system protein [Candidatus Omnitrophota bacterium]